MVQVAMRSRNDQYEECVKEHSERCGAKSQINDKKRAKRYEKFSDT